jgi:hypothetical protein
MTTYTVGYITEFGRKSVEITTTSREAARTQAYAMGYEVCDVSMDDDECDATESDLY